jgi:hypothetical protein
VGFVEAFSLSFADAPLTALAVGEELIALTAFAEERPQTRILRPSRRR